MSNQVTNKIIEIQKRFIQQRDQLRRRVRELENEVDSQALKLQFRDSSRAKEELGKQKRQLAEIEKKCNECSVWIRESNSSDPNKQQNALNRASRL